MLKVDKNKILINRGDIGTLGVSVENDDGTNYIFKVDDVVRFKIMESNNTSVVHKQIDVVVEEETTEVDINLEPEHTTIGELINSPVNYWYEVELNPDTAPQTIIGFDKKGAKILTLYPEGGKFESETIE